MKPSLNLRSSPSTVLGSHCFAPATQPQIVEEIDSDSPGCSDFDVQMPNEFAMFNAQPVAAFSQLSEISQVMLTPHPDIVHSGKVNTIFSFIVNRRYSHFPRG